MNVWKRLTTSRSKTPARSQLYRHETEIQRRARFRFRDRHVRRERVEILAAVARIFPLHHQPRSPLRRQMLEHRVQALARCARQVRCQARSAAGQRQQQIPLRRIGERRKNQILVPSGNLRGWIGGGNRNIHAQIFENTTAPRKPDFAMANNSLTRWSVTAKDDAHRAPPQPAALMNDFLTRPRKFPGAMTPQSSSLARVPK